MTEQADLETLTAGVRQLIPLFDYMGFEITEAGDGRASGRIPVGQNGNHFGVIYAGALFSVAEVLGGVVATTTIALDGFFPLVKALEIKFLRPAATAVVASTSVSPEEVERIRAEALETGKSEYILTTEVTDENGVVVAATSGTYQIRKL